jgi:hypothetical protein
MIFLIIPQAFLNASLRLFAYQNCRYIVAKVIEFPEVCLFMVLPISIVMGT